MLCRKCKTELLPQSVYCHLCGAKQALPKRKPKKRGNGQGSVYQRGKTWTIRLESRINHVRTIKTKGGFPTKKEALNYIDTLKNKRKSSTIADLWDIYSNNAMLKLSASKQAAYKIAYSRIKDILALPLADIKIETLQSCINANAKTYYPARDMKVLLSHIYKMAMAQQEAFVNLASFIVLPNLNETEPTPFTETELKSLWSHYTKDKWTGYVLLMIYSGMMPGELQICEKSMIDLNEQTITGCGLKTKQRKKTPIMIADIIIPVLRDLMTLTETNSLLDMKKNDFYDRFNATLSTAGCRDLTPYACRHTTATALALGNNVAPSVIKKVMRHSNISTTQRYIHPDTKSMLDAVNTISTK